jgi:hypothetical protein
MERVVVDHALKNENHAAPPDTVRQSCGSIR